MLVAVTGGTGYLGAHLVRAVCDAGHRVRLLVTPDEKIDDLLAVLSASGSVETLIGDVRSAETVDALLSGTDAVIHAAGVVGTDDRRADLMWEVNAYAAETVMRTAVARGLDPVVLVSSYAVLTPTTDPVVTLDTPTAQARSAYGKSKGYAERAARVLQQGGAPVVVTYPGSVVGPALHTAPGVTEQGWGAIARSRWAPRVRGGMQMIDVRDVADVHAGIIDAGPGQGPRRYLCGGQMLTFDAMVDAIETGMGRTVRRIPLHPSVFRGLGKIVDVVGRWMPVSGGFSGEAAEFLTAAVPTDDTATLTDLAITWRSPAEAIIDTFRDPATDKL